MNLDGNVLPPMIKFDVENSSSLPAVKGSFFSNDNLQELIVKFLRDFYSIYDSDNRHPLIEAYHDQASFSMSCAHNGIVQYKQPSFAEYIQESRNMVKQKKIFDKNYRLLKKGKLVVVSHLCLLPKTTHDPNSFAVDVGVVTPNMMSFTLTGIFKESDIKKDKPPIRAFSRLFVTIPSGTGILITNDMLTITNALPEQTQTAFKTSGPTPSSSPVSTNHPTLPTNMSFVSSHPSLPTDMSVASLSSNMSLTEASTSTGLSTITPQQQQMLQQFILESKMNLEWSSKCLEENLWNYAKAGQIFLELNRAGKIPPEAFK